MTQRYYMSGALLVSLLSALSAGKNIDKFLLFIKRAAAGRRQGARRWERRCRYRLIGSRAALAEVMRFICN